MFCTYCFCIDKHLYMIYIAWYFQEVKRNKHLDIIKSVTQSVPQSVMLFVTKKPPNYEKRRRGWTPRKCGTHEILGYPISENTVRAKSPWNSCLTNLQGVQPRRVLFSIIGNYSNLKTFKPQYNWKLYRTENVQAFSNLEYKIVDRHPTVNNPQSPHPRNKIGPAGLFCVYSSLDPKRCLNG